ncbi:MAG: hypothetical protein V1774_01245 [Candidatus Eisenbacteria bacterium]
MRRAHPVLAPDLVEAYPEIYRSLSRLYLRIRDNPQAYQDFLNRMLNPADAPRGFEANQMTAAHYLNEAQRYLDALVTLFPRRRRGRLRPDPTIATERDVRALVARVFEHSDLRGAFEARRLMYLALQLFNVARTWEVQRGHLHRDFFAALLERELFHHAVGTRQVDIAFNIAADGFQIEYHDGPPRRGEEVWRFHLRELNFIQDGWPQRLNVYFYSCRSKREVLPYRYVRGQQVYELQTRERWSEMTLRRDASILSKMLRKGTTRPCEIPDIVGAMFIVEDLRQVETLKEALFDILGGPMKIRDMVDTLTREEDRELLNHYSGAGYRVFKADADVLYRPEWGAAEPYVFTVELQIYTLETYLRTIHTRHYASHHRLKQRQFVEGLVPLLFPPEIYSVAPRGSGPRAPSAGAAGALP